MKYLQIISLIASNLFHLAIANNEENLTTVSLQFAIPLGMIPPLFQISEELYFPPCIQNVTSSDIQCYTQLYNCLIGANNWILNNNEEFVCLTNTEISIFNISNNNVSLANQTNITQFNQSYIYNLNGYICFVQFSTNGNPTANIGVYDSLTNSIIANISTSNLFLTPQWPIQTGLFYSSSASTIGFIQYESGNDTVLVNLENHMGLNVVQTYQNETCILAYMGNATNQEVITINVSNTTQYGSSFQVTAAPVRINDTNFILQNGELLSMCQINASNFEIVEQYFINITQYFDPNIRFTVSYLLEVSEIQIYYNYEAFLYFSFDSNGFKFIRATPYLYNSQLYGPALYPTSLNLGSNTSIVFSSLGYWIFNSEGVAFVNIPIQDIYWKNYEIDSLWVFSSNAEGQPCELLNFNSETGNITSSSYFEYPCPNVSSNPAIIAMDNSQDIQPTIVLSCRNNPNQNYVLTPLHTYGPYMSTSPAILNAENTSVYFTQIQSELGLTLVSYNYSSNSTSPSNVTIIPKNLTVIGCKISETLILAMLQSANNKESIFQVYNVTSNQFIQNFTATLPVQPLNIYPHSVNLTSSLPVQSLVLGQQQSFYEFSVNSSRAQMIYPTGWSYYESFGSNSALFYSTIGEGTVWYFEALEYIGLLPVPQPPTPTPSSGSIMKISVLASFALLIMM